MSNNDGVRINFIDNVERDESNLLTLLSAYFRSSIINSHMNRIANDEDKEKEIECIQQINYLMDKIHLYTEKIKSQNLKTSEDITNLLKEKITGFLKSGNLVSKDPPNYPVQMLPFQAFGPYSGMYPFGSFGGPPPIVKPPQNDKDNPNPTPEPPSMGTGGMNGTMNGMGMGMGFGGPAGL